jgi:hypothetical protein
MNWRGWLVVGGTIVFFLAATAIAIIGAVMDSPGPP